MTSRIWITWENQRRSLVLARHFGCALHVIEEKGALRYPRSVLRTLAILMRDRPRTLFVQNPSMFLAALAVIWGALTSTTIVVDRHTTFLLGRDHEKSFRLQLFRALSRFTMRHAAITVVTNEFLAGLVRAAGGTPFVLPDKLPDFSGVRVQERGEREERWVLVVSSFADDEPLDAVVAAASAVEGEPVKLFVTGRVSRAPQQLVASAPKSVVFTDFLPEEEYVEYLHKVDMVMVLTTADRTMLCGCYEAMSAGRALVTSDKPELREYFKGAVFVDNSVESIAEVLRMPLAELQRRQAEILANRPGIHQNWLASAKQLESLVDGRAAC